jgi:antitoxin Phd
VKEFTYSEARQRFSALLDRARRDGAVRIRRRDGQVFVLRPDTRQGSPLDVPGINLDLSTEELLSIIDDGRRPV